MKIFKKVQKISSIGKRMVGDGLGDSVGSGPSGLEIETAGDAVDVEHLTGKIQPWTGSALQSSGKDAFQ